MPAALLALVLVVLAGWLGLRAVRRDGRAGPAPGGRVAVPAPPPVAGSLDRSALARVLGPPEDDLPPERFSERVDGADLALRRAGCLRIVAWREDGGPVPHDLELYVFGTPAEAAAFLAGRGAPAGADRAVTGGTVLLAVGRCAVLGIPDDPAAAADLGRELPRALRDPLRRAGCTGDAR